MPPDTKLDETPAEYQLARMQRRKNKADRFRVASNKNGPLRREQKREQRLLLLCSMSMDSLPSRGSGATFLPRHTHSKLQTTTQSSHRRNKGAPEYRYFQVICLTINTDAFESPPAGLARS